MTDRIIEDLKAVASEAAASVKSQERSDARSLMLSYLNALADTNVKGVFFSWIEGSMHAQASVVLNGVQQDVVFCLHEKKDDCS